jgi:hypothetical protein
VLTEGLHLRMQQQRHHSNAAAELATSHSNAATAIHDGWVSGCLSEW